MSTPNLLESLAGDDGSIVEESGSRHENLFVGHVLPIVKFRRVAEASTTRWRWLAPGSHSASARL
jgi:hypothetical protein